MTSRDEYLESLICDDEESLYEEEAREYYDNVLEPQIKGLNRW